jgi:hypothetical protein
MPYVDPRPGPAARPAGAAPRLVVDVTGHGLGHLGQLAPILAELRARRPRLQLTVRSDLADERLEGMLQRPFARAPAPPDIGLRMLSPVEPDRPSTRAWYDRLEREWDSVLAREVAALRALDPDLLVANVGPVGLAAAAAAGVPAVAVSSLDWASVLEAYGLASSALTTRLREAYAAFPFVQLHPHLEMPWHPDRRPVGPVARRGRPHRAELIARLALPADAVLVLVAFGGIPMPRPLAALPPLDGVVWLADGAAGRGLVPVGPAGLPFPDLLASVDLLITKTGYGLLVEAAVAGSPVLFLRRPDWPEAPHLEGWIERLGLGRPLPGEPDALAAAVRALAAAPRPEPVAPTGIAEAVAILERWL